MMALHRGKYMKRSVDFAKQRMLLIWRSHTEPTELSSGMFAIGWGLWMMLPPTDFLTLRQYWFLLEVASEFVWGIWVFLLGFFIIWSVIYGKKVFRRLGMFAIMLLWMFLTVSFAVVSPALPSTVLFGIMAGKAFWAFVRLK